METFALGDEKEFFITKYKEGSKRATHKNDDEMESILLYHLTYFLTSLTNRLFFLLFLFVIKWGLHV